MVRHWTVRLRTTPPEGRSRLRRARLINAGGALLTGLVLVVVLITKFTHGAYLVVIAMPVLFALMKAIERRHVGEELAPGPGGITMPSRIDAVVLVSRLDLPTLQALAYAKATRPDTLTALTVATGEAEIQQLESEWAERDIPIPLTVVDAPYRDITGPVLRYVVQLGSANPRTLVVVYIPEYVVGRPGSSCSTTKAPFGSRPGCSSSGACWSPACPGSSGPARSGSSTSAQRANGSTRARSCRLGDRIVILSSTVGSARVSGPVSLAGPGVWCCSLSD